MGKEGTERGAKDNGGCYHGMRCGTLVSMKRNDAMHGMEG